MQPQSQNTDVHKVITSGQTADKRDYINYAYTMKSKKWYWVGRRTQDIVFSLLAIGILWPLLILVLFSSGSTVPVQARFSHRCA